jgi:hypothetical protein
MLVVCFVADEVQAANNTIIEALPWRFHQNIETTKGACNWRSKLLARERFTL